MQSAQDFDTYASSSRDGIQTKTHAFCMLVAEVEDELIGDICVTQAVEGNPFSLPRLDRHTFKQGGKDSK